MSFFCLSGDGDGGRGDCGVWCASCVVAVDMLGGFGDNGKGNQNMVVPMVVVIGGSDGGGGNNCVVVVMC